MRRRMAALGAGVLYSLALFFALRAEPYSRYVQLLLQPGLDLAQAEQVFHQEARQEAPLAFCFFGQVPEQNVQCPVNRRQAPVTQVVVAGNPQLLQAGGLAWQEGCYLDENTAQALFLQPGAGQHLTLAGKELPVLGQVETLRPTLITRASQSQGPVLTHCLVAAPPETGRQAGEQFLLRHGLTGRILWGYPVFLAVYDGLLLVPIGLCLGYGCCRIRRLFRARPGSCRGWLAEGGKLIGQAGLAVFLVKKLRLLPQWIPSMWSDLEFWGRVWQQEAENARLLLTQAPGNWQLQMEMDLVKSIWMGAAALGLVLAAVWKGGDSSEASAGGR